MTAGLSTIQPLLSRDQPGSGEFTLSLPGTLAVRDFHNAENLAVSTKAGQDRGSQLGFTAMFGPQDFQHPATANLDYNQVTGASNHNEHRVNFGDRYTQATHMDSRYDDRQGEADYRTQGGLKSSMKYSKPPCLQNTSVMGLSVTGKPLGTTLHQTRIAMPGGGDHDDLRLKLERLAAKFLEKHGAKDAFKDTFIDAEIFDEELNSQNYFKLSLDLLKYAVHSANQPKKRAPEGKRVTSIVMSRLYNTK